jgi:predicted transposase YbfD/YdcC
MAASKPGAFGVAPNSTTTSTFPTWRRSFGYLDFPHLAQVFRIERESIDKKSGALTCETALGITSRSPGEASPERLLAINRGHWSIESVHYIIDWNYDEDRSRIRTGFGPENITRLRRFAVGILKSFQKPAQSIAQSMRKLSFNTRLVFDYLRMTRNSFPTSCSI